MVSICACHARDPGSIPGRGEFLSNLLLASLFRHHEGGRGRVRQLLLGRHIQNPHPGDAAERTQEKGTADFYCARTENQVRFEDGQIFLNTFKIQNVINHRKLRF